MGIDEMPFTISHPPSNIAIVGAGLGGLALALFLRKAKPSLTLSIYEVRPRDATDGGFLALAPNALHVLNQLGPYEILLPHGFAYDEITFYSARNLSRLGSVLNGSREKYVYPALRIPRHIVRQTLMNAVQDAGINIKFETKIKSVEDGDDKGQASLVLSSGKVESHDLIVGADGIHSRIRQLISDVEPTFAGQVGVGGGQIKREDVVIDLKLPAMFMGKTNSFAMMPTTADGQTVSCFATIEMEERTREGWAAFAADKQGLKQRLVERHCGSDAEWPKAVQDACQQSRAESMAIWPFFNAPVLESWTTPSARVILIGDAAHTMPPTGGQGAAQAFEDASSLARVICAVEDAGDLRSELQEWQQRRQERVRQVKAFTSKSGDIRRASPTMLQQIVKEWAIWAYMWLKGKDAGLGWVYAHKESGPVP